MDEVVLAIVLSGGERLLEFSDSSDTEHVGVRHALHRHQEGKKHKRAQNTHGGTPAGGVLVPRC
jgi:hypothetical protein